MQELLPIVMEVGRYNLLCMELLDRANTAVFGTPVPTTASLSVQKGPFIVVSGHDLLDLKRLLEQTEGKGIHIYTHGEMLPAHAYPELKKHRHLKGNFGTAWQNQQKDFTPIIEKALDLGGYSEEQAFTGINGGAQVTTGFGHDAVLSAAGKVIDAVKAGHIKHFFLVAGCDGARSGRNYYTEFVKKTPANTIILTLACGKYRFHDLELGSIEGLPRLMDMGQCNDAYSAIRTAIALAEAFECGVNDLPLSIVLSWYEQKAVCILLTLPAFLSPNILHYLVETFGIAPITTPDEDLRQLMSQSP